MNGEQESVTDFINNFKEKYSLKFDIAFCFVDYVILFAFYFFLL